MDTDPKRLIEEREILRREYARADNERLALQKEVAELRQLLEGSGIPELQKQLKESRTIIKRVVDRVVAPVSKWRRGRVIIDEHRELLDQAVMEISLLDDGMLSAI